MAGIFEHPLIIKNAKYITILDGQGGYLKLPKLTTTQRDSINAKDGMMIYNSTTLQAEVYQNGAWGAVGSGAPVLGSLTDVTLTSPADNEVLAYDSGSGDWINQTPSEAGLAADVDVLKKDGSVALAGDWSVAGYDLADLGKLNFDDATTLTIATGAVTITQTYHSVDTEGSATSDDLDTISGGTAGDVLYLRSADSARTVVIKHGTGNIVTPDGADYFLNSTDKVVALLFDGTNWHLMVAAGTGSSASALSSLTDVTLASPTDNEVLAYDSGSGDWINQTPSEAGLAADADVLKKDGTVALAGDWSIAGYDLADLGKLNFDDATTLTIATGAVTITQTYHSVDTEGAAASDDLDTISGGTAGDVLYLRSADSARTVVIKHGTGNIVTPDGADYFLNSTDKVVALLFDGTNWHLMVAAGTGSSASALSNLIDVTLSSPADNDVLAYDSGSGEWINQTPSEAGLAADADVLKKDGSVALAGDWSIAGYDLADLGKLNFDDATTLTIASGAITITQSYHRVDTEGGAATDDLTTINGGNAGDILYLVAADDAHTVVLKHDDTAGAGKIVTSDGNDYSLDDDNKVVALVYDSADSHWHMVGAAGGGGASALSGLTDVTLSSPTDNEVLAYDSGSGEWINQTPSEAGLAADADVLKKDGTVALAGDWSVAGYDLADLGKLNFDDATTLTIATGAVTITQTYHSIDTEGAAVSDDLDTISGGTAGDIIYLKAADGARTVVLKHGTGNIVTPDGADYSLDDANKLVALLFDGTSWHLVGSAGGSGGADSNAIHDNVAGEIAAITEKTTPTSSDLLLIEDAADSNAKKRVSVGNLPYMTTDGGTFTGEVVGYASTNYTTAQLRNVVLSTSDPSGGSNGDIWIKYSA